MENQIAKFESQTVRLEVVKQLEKMQESKFINLPEGYKESAFFAIEKLANLEGIQNVPAIGITKAMINMFSNKLDYRKNHCYFFVQNDKNSPTGKSLRFGWQYQGLISVAKSQCDVKEVTPVLVQENDIFTVHYEYGCLIIDQHNPSFEGDLKGAYCVVEFNDGRRLIKFYTKSELDKRRDKSQAKNGQFWAWEREMYEKTVINAVLKRLIETSGVVDSSTLYDEPENGGHRISQENDIIQQQDDTFEQQAEVIESKQAEKFKL